MRIALLTDGIYPYVIGGMQKHSFYLAKYFAQNKIEIDLYHATNESNEILNLDCFSLVEKKYIHSIIIPFPKAKAYPGHYIHESFEYSVNIFQEYKKRNNKIDFIYSQGFCGWEMSKKKTDGMSLPPIAINFHGLEMFQKSANLKSKIEQHFFRKPVLKLLKGADIVFSLGGKLTEIIIKKRIPKNKIIQLPIGIDETWVKNDSITIQPKITFIFVGRYERRKGIEELSKVLQKMLDKNFEFHFVGAIPETKKIKSPKIKYWGSISDEAKIKGIYKKADILVCPSYSEGMPTVIMEAMASGLAIIASDVGAIQEQVSKENGILIEPGNSNQLEKVLLAFINIAPDKLIEMKKNSIELVKQKFLWDTVILQTITQIENVIKK